ncbi:MAG: hypothetical protein Q7V88_05285 [Actinomycetota bacterium]|nr:hypothetical protein [Actinomycetota bacterium]
MSDQVADEVTFSPLPQLAAAPTANPTAVLPSQPAEGLPSLEEPWSPEGAAVQAEADEAARQIRVGRAAQRWDSPSGQVPTVTRRVTTEAAPAGRHHTLLPRAMVVGACISAFATPLMFYWLEREGRIDISEDSIAFDDEARRLLRVMVVGTVVSYTIGWLWWTAAAAMNARHRSRWTVAPWLAPLAFVTIAVATAMLPGLTDGASENARIGIVLGWALIVLTCHFGVLGSYRRAASAVGSTQAPWTRLIVLPWVAGGLSVAVSFFASAWQAGLFMVLPVSYLVVIGWYALSMYQALQSFDRACIGRQMMHSDDVLPDFLKRRP